MKPNANLVIHGKNFKDRKGLDRTTEEFNKKLIEGHTVEERVCNQIMTEAKHVMGQDLVEALRADGVNSWFDLTIRGPVRRVMFEVQKAIYPFSSNRYPRHHKFHGHGDIFHIKEHKIRHMIEERRRNSQTDGSCLVMAIEKGSHAGTYIFPLVALERGGLLGPAECDVKVFGQYNDGSPKRGYAIPCSILIDTYKIDNKLAMILNWAKGGK